MSGDKVQSNSKCQGFVKTRAMIDANMQCSSIKTVPDELLYLINGTKNEAKGLLKNITPFVDIEGTTAINNIESSYLMGNKLIKLNTNMFNNWVENAGNLDKKDIPSLAIVSTIDMEFAYALGHHEHVLSVGENWKQQIENTEKATLENPLRLFPLFYYDPHRYCLEPDSKTKIPYEKWDAPFSRIVGCKEPANGVNKIWLGFCMNPYLGFMPFAESYKQCLQHFYKKCEEEHIPILADCVRGGIATQNVNVAWTHPYYNSYGHPNNWNDVLQKYPNLHLCLAGFGGNEVWKDIFVGSWVSDYPVIELLSKKQKVSDAQFNQPANAYGVEWIRSIIQHTKNKNVYTDISGLDIYNDLIKCALKKILILTFTNDTHFKHLKDKIIFGSGWYMTLAQNSENASYKDYCGEFRKLFAEIENELKICSGVIWERVSLINPWNFYEFHNKIHQMCHALAKDANLDNMIRVFFGSSKINGLIKYVSSRNSTYNSLKPDEVIETETNASCGIGYRHHITCAGYKDKDGNSYYGPRYLGHLPLESYEKWDILLSQNKIDATQKKIIIAVSGNEGKLDSVQSYDKALISVGVMQKIINSNGFGQFPDQMAAFKEIHPEKFTLLFKNCGWTVKLDDKNRKWRAYYNDTTGKDLKLKIRRDCSEFNVGKEIKCIPLEPLINATNDPYFQAMQIMDFVEMLKYVLNKKPIRSRYTKFTLKDYLKSNLGKAVALDQEVNIPAYVSRDFGMALDYFYDTYDNNRKVPDNPNDWGEKHKDYEQYIIEFYGNRRSGTHMPKRYQQLKTHFQK